MKGKKPQWLGTRRYGPGEGRGGGGAGTVGERARRGDRRLAKLHG